MRNNVVIFIFLVFIMIVPATRAQSNPELSPYETLLDASYTGEPGEFIYVPLPEAGAMYRITGTTSSGVFLKATNVSAELVRNNGYCPSSARRPDLNDYYLAANPEVGEQFTYLCLDFAGDRNSPPVATWNYKIEKIYSPTQNPLMFAGGGLGPHELVVELAAGATISGRLEWKYPTAAGASTPALSTIPEHRSVNPSVWFGICLQYRLKNNNANWSGCIAAENSVTIPAPGIYSLRVGWGSVSSSRGPGLVQLLIAGGGTTVDCTKIYSKRSGNSARYHEIWLEGNYTGASGFLYDLPGDEFVASRVTLREGQNGPESNKSLPATVTIPAPYHYLGDMAAGVLFYNSLSDPIFPAPFVLELCSGDLAPIPTPSPTPPTTCIDMYSDYSKSPPEILIPAIYVNWIATITAGSNIIYDQDGLVYDTGQFFTIKSAGRLASPSTFSIHICTYVQPSPTPTPVLCSYLDSQFVDGLHRVQNSRLIFFVGFYTRLQHSTQTVSIYGAGTTKTLLTNSAHLVYSDSYVYSTAAFQLAFCERAQPTMIPTGTITPGTPTATPTGTITPGTPTATPTGTITPGTPTATQTAVPTPTRGYPDGIPTPTWCPPWLLTPSPVGIYGVLPDFSIPWPESSSISTIEITFTMHISPVQTMQALLLTPIAQTEQLSSAFTPESAIEFSNAANTYMVPALSWFGILNPSNSAWEQVGGPLWALEPILKPLLPLLLLSIPLAVARLILFISSWIMKLFDVLAKLIELIPGE